MIVEPVLVVGYGAFAPGVRLLLQKTEKKFEKTILFDHTQIFRDGRGRGNLLLSWPYHLLVLGSLFLCRDLTVFAWKLLRALADFLAMLQLTFWPGSMVRACMKHEAWCGHA